jgi:hypothetical protein
MKPINYNDRVEGTMIMIYYPETVSDRMKFGIVRKRDNGMLTVEVFRVYYTTLLENQLIWVRCREDGNTLIFSGSATFELTPEEANAILIERI